MVVDATRAIRDISFADKWQAAEFEAIVASSSGATEIVAAIPGRRIRVLGLVVTAANSVNVKFQSASNDITGLYYCSQNGGVAVEHTIGLFQTAVGEALNINLGGNVGVGGHLSYVSV